MVDQPSISLWRAHRNVKLRLMVAFINRFLAFMLAPLMAILFATSFGARAAGLMLALVVVATMCCSFLGGHLADVRGRRATLLISEAGVLVAYTCMWLANSPWWHNPELTYGAFLLNSCMGGLGFPASDAVMMDIATPQTRSAIYTANYWLMNLAFASGALVGGLFHGSQFGWLLLLGLVLCSTSYATTVFALVETKPRASADRAGRPPGKGVRSAIRQYRYAAADRVFIRLTCAAVLITTVEMQLTYYLGIHLAAHFTPRTLLQVENWRLTVDGIGMLSVLRMLNTVLVVALALVVGRLLRALGDRVRMYAGITVFVIGFMGLALTRDPWLLIGCSLVYTVGELMNVPVRQGMLADLVDPVHRSRYMALYGMRPRAAALLASLSVVVGAMLPSAGMAVLYALLGCTAMLLLRRPFRTSLELRRAAALAALSEPNPDTDKAVPVR